MVIKGIGPTSSDLQCAGLHQHHRGQWGRQLRDRRPDPADRRTAPQEHEIPVTPQRGDLPNVLLVTDRNYAIGTGLGS